ncbi:MAG: hypothetical protein R3E01_33770 [Pirellulaceae bacterium]|nr:hypothetical protein [Planctomycetales bacterium]
MSTILFASVVAIQLPLFAADYHVDANYSGPNGAAFGRYAGAYRSIVDALSDG